MNEKYINANLIFCLNSRQKEILFKKDEYFSFISDVIKPEFLFYFADFY